MPKTETESIVIFDLDTSPTSQEPVRTRGWMSDKVLAPVLAKPSVIAADQLKKNMRQFLKSMGSLLEDNPSLSNGYELDQVDVAATISASGQIGILGSNLAMQGKGAITFRFKRVSKSRYTS